MLLVLWFASFSATHIKPPAFEGCLKKADENIQIGGKFSFKSKEQKAAPILYISTLTKMSAIKW